MTVLAKRCDNVCIAHRRARRQAQASDAVEALNTLIGAQCAGPRPPSAAQASAQQVIRQLAFVIPSSPVVQPRKLWMRFLVRTSRTRWRRSLLPLIDDRGRVSMPALAGQAPLITDVLDPAGRAIVEGYAAHMLKVDTLLCEEFERGARIRSDMDARLKNDPSLYRQFLQDLLRAGMITFDMRPIGVVCPCFVRQKGQKQRLVWDCREVSRLFLPPPPLAMASGSAWASLDIPPGEPLNIAHSDLNDFLYHLSLPDTLMDYFCLPPIDGSALLVVDPSGGSFGHLLDDLGQPPLQACPKLVAAPMGWNWAAWVAQRVHLHQVLLRARLQMRDVLVDGTAAPQSSNESVVVLPCIDNLNVAGLDPERVRQVRDDAALPLRKVGFLVHEETGPDLKVNSLGYDIDSRKGMVTPSSERLARLSAALGWLDSRPRISGWQLECFLGHVVHAMLVRRSLLATLRVLYDFSRDS